MLLVRGGMAKAMGRGAAVEFGSGGGRGRRGGEAVGVGAYPLIIFINSFQYILRDSNIFRSLNLKNVGTF